MSKLTFKEVKEQLAEIGVSLRREVETNEYRVNLLTGYECTAYYATDLEDALATGKAMAKSKALFFSDLMESNNKLADAIHKAYQLYMTEPVDDKALWSNRLTTLKELKSQLEQMIEDKETS
jgi:succinate dehydrogenase/fumarate reductase flavoprotein subunit